MSNTRDDIYATPLNELVDFAFDEKVAAVFPDMIQRSVPGYGMLITTIGLLSRRYAQAGSRCYDLGCSLGAVSLSMRQRITQPGATIVAVDNSAAMLEKARGLLERAPGSVPVELVCADLREVAIEDASVVVLNFTLQFIPPAERHALLTRIYAGLRPGGILVLSEKIAFEEPGRQQFHETLHHDFKRLNGYSDLEISQKRSALEKVMIPETLATHQARLKAAGFPFGDLYFQTFNFASLVAVK